MFARMKERWVRATHLGRRQRSRLLVLGRVLPMILVSAISRVSKHKIAQQKKKDETDKKVFFLFVYLFLDVLWSATHAGAGLIVAVVTHSALREKTTQTEKKKENGRDVP